DNRKERKEKGIKKKLGGLGGEIKNRKWPFGRSGFIKREIEPIMPFFIAYGMTVNKNNASECKKNRIKKEKLP
ncbi:MAG: hypothetical protein GX946_01155, partial [Oligosphaeraceae bacterium]|nr:hypothetical protein [Oligosphaeraceae bacterium]